MRPARGVAAIGAALLLGACDDAPGPVAQRNLILDAQGVVFAGGAAPPDRFSFGSRRAEIEQAAADVDGTTARPAGHRERVMRLSPKSS